MAQMTHAQVIDASRRYPIGAAIFDGKWTMLYLVLNNPQLLISSYKTSPISVGEEERMLLQETAMLRNSISCDILSLLKECSIPVAFKEQDSTTSFVIDRCKTLPYSTLVLGSADAAYVKRYPTVPLGEKFSTPVVEHFLRANNRFKKVALGYKDPLVRICQDEMELYDRDAPVGTPIARFLCAEVFKNKCEFKHLARMEKIAREGFMVLKRAFLHRGQTLASVSFGFGINYAGDLVIASAIDDRSLQMIPEITDLKNFAEMVGKCTIEDVLTDCVEV